MTQYLKVDWKSGSTTEPSTIFMEISDDGFETRKVHEFSDVSLGFSDHINCFNDTRLAYVPIPSIEEINEDLEFKTYAIDAAQFEDIWLRARSSFSIDQANMDACVGMQVVGNISASQDEWYDCKEEHFKGKIIACASNLGLKDRMLIEIEPIRLAEISIAQIVAVIKFPNDQDLFGGFILGAPTGVEYTYIPSDELLTPESFIAGDVNYGAFKGVTGCIESKE